MSLRDSVEEELSVEMPLTIQLGPPEATFTTLPDELLECIFRLVHGKDQKKTLANLMEANRHFYFLGLPMLLRELKFPLSGDVTVERKKKEDAFLVNGLDPEKFRLVKKLELLPKDGSPFYWELLRRAAPFVEDLTLGVFEIDKQEPDVFWDALPRPLKIKKTKIVSHPILFTVWNGVRLDNRKSRDEGGARFYAPLLELLDVDTSEELRLDELAAISGESFLVMKWPLRLRLYPRLASKLVDITVNDRDVDDWARLECNAVNHVTLDWCFFGEGTNAFPLSQSYDMPYVSYSRLSHLTVSRAEGAPKVEPRRNNGGAK